VSETSKYDLFLDELNALEKQIYYFIQKGTELLDSNQALNNRITLIERENDTLKKKINDIESKVSKSFVNSDNLFGNESFNLEEKEALKNKISELIAKIDYHLRS
jgi:predicted  nucleic acid-binding Zn-ribbon protein